jgi:hypothetical protein
VFRAIILIYIGEKNELNFNQSKRNFMHNKSKTNQKSEYKPQHKASSLFFLATCFSITSSVSYLLFNLEYLLILSSVFSIFIMLFAIIGGATFFRHFGPQPIVEMELDLPIFILVNLAFLSSLISLSVEVFFRGAL